MNKLDREQFRYLGHPPTEDVLYRLYGETLKQNGALFRHFLPKIFRLLGKGIDWKDENPAFYDDKYIPIYPQQGAFLYLQALATGARHIVELGTSYGISTLYLALAAKRNGGRVITCEKLAHKAQAARAHFRQAGLADIIELREGDALATLQHIDHPIDLVLLDGWPDGVWPVFRLLEARLSPRAVIVVDDVHGFAPSMQPYLDYIRNPANGYRSATLKPGKALEYSVKHPNPASPPPSSPQP